MVRGITYIYIHNHISTLYHLSSMNLASKRAMARDKASSIKYLDARRLASYCVIAQKRSKKPSAFIRQKICTVFNVKKMLSYIHYQLSTSPLSHNNYLVYRYHFLGGSCYTPHTYIHID